MGERTLREEGGNHRRRGWEERESEGGGRGPQEKRMGERGRDKGITKINYRHRIWVSVHNLNNNGNNLLFPHNYQITTQMVVIHGPRDGCLPT